LLFKNVTYLTAIEKFYAGWALFIFSPQNSFSK